MIFMIIRYTGRKIDTWEKYILKGYWGNGTDNMCKINNSREIEKIFDYTPVNNLSRMQRTNFDHASNRINSNQQITPLNIALNKYAPKWVAEYESKNPYIGEIIDFTAYTIYSTIFGQNAALEALSSKNSKIN